MQAGGLISGFRSRDSNKQQTVAPVLFLFFFHCQSVRKVTMEAPILIASRSYTMVNTKKRMRDNVPLHLIHNKKAFYSNIFLVDK